MGIKLKTCDKHQVNNIDHPDKFHYQKRKTGKNHYYICRQCRYEKRRQYYLDHREHELKTMKQWRKKNPDKWKLLCKKHNGLFAHKYSTEEEFREEIKKQRSIYRKKWKNNNRERYRELIKIYKTKRFARDPGYKIQEILRSRISRLVKVLGTRKADKSINLLGCSTSELKIHLEKKFEDGMNWDNYGVWHVDHIIPCARFDLTDPEQQKICFHYTNLQPMWGEHNIKKGARLC